jgi:hypothetical protein
MMQHKCILYTQTLHSPYNKHIKGQDQLDPWVPLTKKHLGDLFSDILDKEGGAVVSFEVDVSSRLVLADDERGLGISLPSLHVYGEEDRRLTSP